MKNIIRNKHCGKIFIRVFPAIACVAVFLLLMQSCGKGDTARPGNGIPANSSHTGNAVAGTITKKQALDRLNEHFKNEFSPIAMKQVNAVTRQQFRLWLRNSVMAPAEDMYVSPLLESDGLAYLIIKNVTVQANGKKASIGLIATTPKFYQQYTHMVAIIGYTKIPIGDKHICSWKKCDSYSPCPCITWIDFRYGDCPSDRCQYNLDCQGYNPASDCNGELTGITTYDVFAAF